MTPARAQLLEEIGVVPRWTLREVRSVARATAQPVAAGRVLVAGEGAAALPPTAAAPTAVAQMGWAELGQAIAACRACPLGSARRQAVVGVGDEAADWLFVGEGPGAEEDARGEPFVGEAGKLLDAMLAAIGLARGRKVYIANAVKCRPPNNRTPEAAEVATCRRFLERQIELLQPKLIVVLGRTAALSLLGEGGSLSGLRGAPRVYRGTGGREIPAVVSYHPAYLLRSPTEKARVWEDLCRARALMRRLAS